MKKTLASGIELDITMAPFTEGYRLFQSVLRELQNIPIKVGLRGASFSSLAEMDVNEEILDTIKNVVAVLLSSPEVEGALIPCLQRVTYGGKKLGTGTDVFESEQAREDYVVVMKEVLVYNLTPFFKGLTSGLSSLLPNLSTGDQK